MTYAPFSYGKAVIKDLKTSRGILARDIVSNNLPSVSLICMTYAPSAYNGFKVSH